MNEATSEREKADAEDKFMRAYDDLQQLTYLIQMSSTEAQGGLTMADIHDEIDRITAD